MATDVAKIGIEKDGGIELKRLEAESVVDTNGVSAEAHMNDSAKHLPDKGAANTQRILLVEVDGTIKWVDFGSVIWSDTGMSAGNVPTLDASGKLPASIMPQFVVMDTFVVGSEAAMLALPDAEQGDICIRTDESKTYILKAAPASSSSNWEVLLFPQSPVTSVAGRKGDITLTKEDVGLGNVNNTADSSKSVASAAKLTTARTLALTGDVTGTVSFDGSANATIKTTAQKDAVFVQSVDEIATSGVRPGGLVFQKVREV